jgi:hypothetical protein
MTDMKNVDHTHPYDDRNAGKLFRRGPTVVADGGRRDERRSRQTASDGGEADAEPEERDEGSENRMRDVSHDDPEGDGANRVFERGREHDESEENVGDKEHVAEE